MHSVQALDTTSIAILYSGELVSHLTKLKAMHIHKIKPHGIISFYYDGGSLGWSFSSLVISVSLYEYIMLLFLI